MRHAAAVLITAAATVLTLVPSTARAVSSAFNGPQAVGVMAGAGLVTGILCWTVELANAESKFDAAPPAKRDDDYERTGWFVGVKGVAATEFLNEGKEQKDIAQRFGSDSIKFEMRSQRTSGGLSFQVGRRCNDRFSIEVDIEKIGAFHGKILLTNPNPPTVDSQVSFSPTVGTLNMKGYLLTGRFQPYGLLGVGLFVINEYTKTTRTRSHQTTGLLALRFGGGLDFYLTRSWLVNTEISYVHSATNIQSLDYLSVGLGIGYRF